MLGIDWVVGKQLQELDSCSPVAEVHKRFAPLAGCLSLKQCLTNAGVHKRRSSSYGGGFASLLEHPYASSVTLNLNEKQDVEAIFYFLLGARERKAEVCTCNFKKEKKIEFHWDSLLFYFLFYSRCLLVCLTNVSLPPGIWEYIVQSSHNLPGYFYNNLSSADTAWVEYSYHSLWLLEVWNYIFVFEVRHTVSVAMATGWVMASTDRRLVFKRLNAAVHKALIFKVVTELSPFSKCLKITFLHGLTRLIVMVYFI